MSAAIKRFQEGEIQIEITNFVASPLFPRYVNHSDHPQRKCNLKLFIYLIFEISLKFFSVYFGTQLHGCFSFPRRHIESIKRPLVEVKVMSLSFSDMDSHK